MRKTGMTRPIDDLGRIVIPAEIRKSFGLEIKDRVEFFINSDGIMIKKAQVKCVFCDNKDDLLDYQDIKVCPACVKAIRAIKPSRR